jgi:hypothetical protein
MHRTHERRKNMKIVTMLSVVALALVNGCATQSGAAPAGSTAQAGGTCGVSASPCATRPDGSKAREHFAKHVNYPATRTEILAACAQTPEFTAAEKQWLADNLPEGKYANAGDVSRALKL